MQLCHDRLCAAVRIAYVIGCVLQHGQGLELEKCGATPEADRAGTVEPARSFIQHRTRQVQVDTGHRHEQARPRSLLARESPTLALKAPALASHGEQADTRKSRGAKKSKRDHLFAQVAYNALLVAGVLVALFFVARNVLSRAPERSSSMPALSMKEGEEEPRKTAEQKYVRKSGTENPGSSLLIQTPHEEAHGMDVMANVLSQAASVANVDENSSKKPQKATRDKSGKTKTVAKARQLVEPPQTSSDIQDVPKPEELAQHRDPEVTGLQDADGTGSASVPVAAPEVSLLGEAGQTVTNLPEDCKVDPARDVSKSSTAAADNPSNVLDKPCTDVLEGATVQAQAEVLVPLADRLDALRELKELKARQDAQKRLEDERVAAVASLEKLDADQAKMGEEEDAAEKAFKLLPYKARSGAASKIGDPFWAGSSWRARLAAAQEVAQELTQDKAPRKKNARSKKQAAPNKEASANASDKAIQVV